MNRSVTFVLFSAAIGALVPAHAAVAGGQEQGPPALLRAATLVVDVASPRNARVRADFELTAASESVLLFTQIPGQRIDGLRFESGGVEIMPEREQRSSAILAYRLPAGTAQGAVSVAYEIDSDAGAAYRFALPVPEATPSGEERAVRLDVRLPPGAAFAGNAFPALAANGSGGWSNEAVAVPALLHVVFGDAGPSLHAHRLLEVTAIALAVALIGGGWLFHRRREAA